MNLEKELIAASFDKIRTSEFISQNNYSVLIYGSKNGFIFEPYLVEYLHEEKKKRVIVKIRYCVSVLDEIIGLGEMTHTILPNWLISKKDKFNISLMIHDKTGTKMHQFLRYKDCVVKRVTHPMFFYGKDSDKVATAYIEFKYSKKEPFLLCDENTEKKIKDILDIYNEYKFRKEFDRKKERDEAANDLTTSEDIEKFEKIMNYSNQMLDDALKTAEKHYENRDSAEFNIVKRDIENAKVQNNNRKKHAKYKYNKKAIEIEKI